MGKRPDLAWVKIHAGLVKMVLPATAFDSWVAKMQAEQPVEDNVFELVAGSELGRALALKSFLDTLGSKVDAIIEKRIAAWLQSDGCQLNVVQY